MWNLPITGAYRWSLGNCASVVDGLVATNQSISQASVMEQVPRWLNMLPTSSSGIGAGLLFPLYLSRMIFRPSARATNSLWPRKLLGTSNFRNCPGHLLLMLLNEAERLGVLYGRIHRVMESALTELPWSAFELWVWLNGDRIFEARFRDKADHKEESSDVERAASPSDGDEQGEAGQEEAAAPSDNEKQEEGERENAQHATTIMAFPSFHNTREMADFVRESFRLRWRRATCPPHPLLNDYQDFCPRFSLSKAERAALDFELPEMVQATFYAMLWNDALELGIVSGFLVGNLKSSLEGQRVREAEGLERESV
ncbi:hypothetical protein Cgig2_017613 [Carnegiea gigantea]|uniref:Uncharacterized protein n=1 Tax=Carnegiea gigantea TaxID=171969 RepID=A0A9Q1Q904_9CARY|nr:hypothetical protein Cgig2_017613 [Carnegiea gigantea]